MKFLICLPLMLMLTVPSLGQEGEDTIAVKTPQEIVALVSKMVEKVDSSKTLQTTLKIGISLTSVKDSTTLEQLVIQKGIKGPFLVVRAIEQEENMVITYKKGKTGPANGEAIKKQPKRKIAKENVRLKGDY